MTEAALKKRSELSHMLLAVVALCHTCCNILFMYILKYIVYV